MFVVLTPKDTRMLRFTVKYAIRSKVLTKEDVDRQHWRGSVELANWISH